MFEYFYESKTNLDQGYELMGHPMNRQLMSNRLRQTCPKSGPGTNYSP